MGKRARRELPSKAMAKRLRPTSNYSEESELQGNCDSQDGINHLPDDILVFILSHLTFKEAAVTSVVSRRWRYLWTSYPVLNFGATETLNGRGKGPKLLAKERCRYISWVNSVLRQYRGTSTTIDEFRICFDLDRDSKRDIDGWIKFAMRKKIQRLELDLLEHGVIWRRPQRHNYRMFCKLLDPSRVSSKNPSSLPGLDLCPFVGLKSLILRSVNLSGAVLENFLFYCPVLEQLSVHGSAHLVNLRVFGPSLKLKNLEIIHCVDLKTIEICDTNLISFNYSGGKISLLLENVPLLVKVSMFQRCFRSEHYIFSQLSCCLSQLEVLAFEIDCLKEWIEITEFPKLTKLKQLVLEVTIRRDESLLDMASLIKLCPHLQKFVLKLSWWAPLMRRRARVVKCPHQYLKVVELVGYYGCAIDFELALFFIENAIALEKIIIHPTNQVLGENPRKFKAEQAARNRAKQQLEAEVPPRIELVII